MIGSINANHVYFGKDSDLIYFKILTQIKTKSVKIAYEKNVPNINPREEVSRVIFINKILFKQNATSISDKIWIKK